MSGDYSRITFDPWQDDFGVLLQQGRPLSDAEWNALTLQLRRRIHAGTLDTIGAAVVPMQTPDAFKMTLIAGGLGIGRGRMYVDGLLAENHGGGATSWEPRLEDLIGTQVLSYAPLAGFDAQPYYPNPPALPTGGPHLIYLDVWQREVTHLIRPELIEKAVGVDSTTHLQTVWQVKLLNNVGTAVDCQTPLDQIPGWLPANAPSAGRLTTSTAVVPGEPDPCLIPPGGGYKGLENQLYRIEIHTGGGLGTATFKWSRENASVETRITHIPALNQLTVESIGKDSVLRFSDGDWVEITDDWLELHNQPGELRRIKIGNGVDDATRTIILDQPLTAGLFPTDAMNRTQPGRHTRIKRWDQRGQVLDQNGNVLQDLDLAASNGEITVPAGTGVSVLLEHGIVATFTLDPAGGQFKPGDYWMFAARSTDATIEELDAAPPRGIHHHYAKLGYVTFPNAPSDCRIFWPPPIPTAGGDNCACTVCVTPQDHSSGTMTIQMAIDKVIAAGGGTICLEVGNYNLEQTLLIEGAQSLKLVGKGFASRLLQASAQGAVLVNKSKDITLESFQILCRGTVTAQQDALAIRSSQAIRVERLLFRIESNQELWSAIGLAEALMDISLRENTIRAPNGIRSTGTATGGATGLADLRIENNTFECHAAGVRLAQLSVHQLVNRLCGNRVTGCQDAGFILTGMSAPGFGIEVANNAFSVLGHGIVASMNGLSIIDNDILQDDSADPKQQRGIALIPGAAASNLQTDCQILGNRIAGFHGVGIFVGSALQAAMIKQNQIEHVGNGLIFGESSLLDQVSIENNQFDDVTGFAMRAEGQLQQLAVTGNQMHTRAPSPAVQLISARGDFIFSHNHCQHEGGPDSSDVVLKAGTLIVGNNRVVGSSIALDLHAAQRHYTVLGNICRGKITIVGASLPAPWAPLNIEGV